MPEAAVTVIVEVPAGVPVTGGLVPPSPPPLPTSTSTVSKPAKYGIVHFLALRSKHQHHGQYQDSPQTPMPSGDILGMFTTKGNTRQRDVVITITLKFAGVVPFKVTDGGLTD